ncbi:histidine phosphatase family protein [Streptosporangiaceae bacterium NEAU-GS5]|nr:histidine phosphatase family protein [Streptosporangiaceae bacterium NEAU-GS5]
MLRHAKAVHVAGLADIERPLTGRGERNAREAGELIRPLAPQLVLSSPSVRTRQTAELLGLNAPIEYDRDIYGAYPDELVDVVRRVDAEVETLVLVGHNPGVQELTLLLSGGHDEGFPPGAFAVIELPGPWSEIDPATGHVVQSHKP